MPIKLNTENFILKAKEVHGDKYDYSKVDYVNNSTKVCIICPEHGEFFQRPQDHLKKHGCPCCGNVKHLDNKTFIKKAIQVHGDKYDYSKVEYVNNKTKVCIICPEHGEFWQKPELHINQKQGCPKCCKTKKLTTEEFINRAKEVHGDKYDYSKVEYANSRTKVCIICPEHGEFWQTPSMHLKKHGCPKCGSNRCKEKNTLTCKQFINRAKEVHGDKYDYSKVEYANSQTKVCIICPEHGEFWQIANYHLSGCGCPKCAAEHNINENNFFLELSTYLNTPIIREKTFKWLKNKHLLKLDFYLPEYNVAIEYQGEQHFQPIEFFGGEEKYVKQKENDEIKKELCKQHGIKLLYFTYNNIKNDEILTNINELIQIIYENRN